MSHYHGNTNRSTSQSSLFRDESVSGGSGSGNGSADSDDDTLRVYHVTIPGTFVEVSTPPPLCMYVCMLYLLFLLQVQLSEAAPVFKEGFVMRKNILDGPHKKVPRGKRQWKSYYAYLKGFLLYFFPVRSLYTTYTQ